MKGKLAILLVLTAIVLIDHSTATSEAKSREKRSPNPQFQFVGALFKLAAKQVQTVVKLARKATTAAGKNQGTAIAGGATAVVGGAAIASVIAAGAKPGQKQCVVHIRQNLPDLQPVFISSGFPRTLMVPRNGFLIWAHQETSTIACPSSSSAQNYIVATNNIVDTITCEDGLMFKLNGALIDISTITCNQKVTGNTQSRPDPQCAGSNRAIGFNVPFPTGYIFFELYYSCFNETGATTLYTSHTLFGTEIMHKCIYRGTRPDFKAAGFTEGMAVSSAYIQSSQKARLANIFTEMLPSNVAQTEAQSYYSRSYLQKGHLTPDGDELFTTWQWATYFFINVAGMWEKINIGNWKNIEAKVRTLANDAGENLRIYTGTYGTLSLCSISSPSFCPQFTLANGGIPVPKWLWKIVVAPIANAAIALVVSNNPFERVPPICGSSQTDYGWQQDGFDNIAFGAVSYCTVQELSRVIGYIPQSAMAPNVLNY